ncbi:MAG TPA: HAD family phosphatase [Candidatus Latescibacteria bacterium]|nr:HAD family phosphatase [Candidatus Latescibacterota bacterium]
MTERVTVAPVNLLCDMDGTLVDTEGLKDEALRRAIADARGSDLDPEEQTRIYSRYVGMPGIDIARAMIGHYRLVVSADELWELREQHRRVLYSDVEALQARVVSPVVALVDRFREGIAVTGRGKTVLVTTAGGDQVHAVLGATKLGHLFDLVVSGREKSRDNPACYRAALEACRARPEECLALEDSVVGYEAARSLDIPCLLLPNSYTRHQRLENRP